MKNSNGKWPDCFSAGLGGPRRVATPAAFTLELGARAGRYRRAKDRAPVGSDHRRGTSRLPGVLLYELGRHRLSRSPLSKRRAMLQAARPRLKHLDDLSVREGRR